jgi:tRNA-2-methylthio-N6-dimethylallyladenosine synthase
MATDALSDLMARIHDTAGIERIKFVTNFPRDMTDDLLYAVRDLPKVCRYLHVPAQSGCNEQLRRMKRLYTVEYYRDMLQRCREVVPGVAISSDFIVGFSGETEQSFARTCDLVRTAGFKNSFIFKYSPRPGTKAHELFEDDVPEAVKKRRNNELLEIQGRVSLDNHRRWIGASVEVLVEGLSKTALRQPDAGPIKQLCGRTMTDHIVVFDGPEQLLGSIVRVDIDDATAYTLFGTLALEIAGSDSATPAVAAPANSRRMALPLV